MWVKGVGFKGARVESIVVERRLVYYQEDDAISKLDQYRKRMVKTVKSTIGS